MGRGGRPTRARLGLEICASLADFWDSEKAVPTASRWYPRALVADTTGDTPERAKVLLGLADNLMWSEASGIGTSTSRTT